MPAGSNRPLDKPRRLRQPPEGKKNVELRSLHLVSRATQSSEIMRGPFPAQERRPRAVRRVLSMNVALPGLTPHEGEESTALPAANSPSEEPLAVLALRHVPRRPTSAVPGCGGGDGGEKFSVCRSCDQATGDAWKPPSTPLSKGNRQRRQEQGVPRCGGVGSESREDLVGWEDGTAGLEKFDEEILQDINDNGDDDGGRVREFLEATKEFAVGNKTRVRDVWTPVSDNGNAPPEVRNYPTTPRS